MKYQITARQAFGSATLTRYTTVDQVLPPPHASLHRKALKSSESKATFARDDVELLLMCKSINEQLRQTAQISDDLALHKLHSAMLDARWETQRRGRRRQGVPRSGIFHMPLRIRLRLLWLFVRAGLMQCETKPVYFRLNREEE